MVNLPDIQAKYIIAILGTLASVSFVYFINYKLEKAVEKGQGGLEDFYSPLMDVMEYSLSKYNDSTYILSKEDVTGIDKDKRDVFLNLMLKAELYCHGELRELLRRAESGQELSPEEKQKLVEMVKKERSIYYDYRAGKFTILFKYWPKNALREFREKMQ